jgi:hypothetical protein
MCGVLPAYLWQGLPCLPVCRYHTWPPVYTSAEQASGAMMYQKEVYPGYLMCALCTVHRERQLSE